MEIYSCFHAQSNIIQVEHHHFWQRNFPDVTKVVYNTLAKSNALIYHYCITNLHILVSDLCGYIKKGCNGPTIVNKDPIAAFVSRWDEKRYL
jgi:hypothetical protein